jgi:hypothetical protein
MSFSREEKVILAVKQILHEIPINPFEEVTDDRASLFMRRVQVDGEQVWT